MGINWGTSSCDYRSAIDEGLSFNLRRMFAPPLIRDGATQVRCRNSRLDFAGVGELNGRDTVGRVNAMANCTQCGGRVGMPGV
jgi:hypothetical protein